MAAEHSLVTQEVLDIAREIIDEHRPDLQDAHITFLFRDKAQRSGSHIVYGTAQKVKGEYQALGIDADFLIILAEDLWYTLDDNQRKALIHHELCHCTFAYKEDGDPEPKMRKHDFEEFNIIIQLYGFWWPNNTETVEAIQAALPMMDFTEPRKARLSALDPAMLNGRG